MYNDVNDMRFCIQVDISSVQVLVLLASIYFVIFSDCQYHIGLHGNLRTGFRGARILQFCACPLASLAKFFFLPRLKTVRRIPSWP